jgi:tight adherence protein B
VSAAALLATCAAGAGVWGTWELVAAIEQASVARAVGQLLKPLRSAGRDGREPGEAERRRLRIVGSAVVLAGTWLLAGPAPGVLAAVAAPALLRRLVAARRRRWRAALADGAPAAARALADALAGGHSIRGALAEAARGDSVPGAAGVELRRCARALDLGERTEVVLEGLRRRAGDPAWDTIVAAVLLQRDAGGDLASLLRNVAAAREEARRVEADARGATAQARYTAGLVCGLPLAAATLVELVSPGAMAAILATPLAALMVGLSVGLQLTAWAAVRRISRIAEGAW